MTQVEDARRISGRPAPSRVPRHQTPDVFREGDAELCGAGASAAMVLGIEQDLGACHHSVAIIMYVTDRAPTQVFPANRTAPNLDGP
jgi:hypothetical protein